MLNQNAPSFEDWVFTNPFGDDSSTKSPEKDLATKLAKLAPSPLRLTLEDEIVEFNPELVDISDEEVRCLAQGVVQGELTFVRIRGELGDESLSFEVIDVDSCSSVLTDLVNSDDTFKKIGTISELSIK